MEQLTAHTNFNANLVSFMYASKIGAVPLRHNGVGLEWGAVGSSQAAVSPVLDMSRRGLRHDLGQGDLTRPCRLFESWESLHAIRRRISGEIQRVPQDLRAQSFIMKAELTADMFTRSLLLASAGTPYTDKVASEAMWSEADERAVCEDFCSAALIAELALEMTRMTAPGEDVGQDLYSKIAALWLNSLSGESAPRIERFKVSRGILYGFGGARPVVYRDLLLESAEAHAQEDRIDEAAEDIIRVVQSISDGEDTEDVDWGTASTMLSSAAELFEDSGNEEIEMDQLLSLVIEANDLA